MAYSDALPVATGMPIRGMIRKSIVRNAFPPGPPTARSHFAARSCTMRCTLQEDAGPPAPGASALTVGRVTERPLA